MAFFKEAPIKGLTRDHDAAKSNVDRLAIRLTTAEQAVIDAKTLAQSRALSGDDAGLDAAEVAGAAALLRLSSIAAAHTEAEQVLAKLDNQISAALDAKTRAATAREAEALASDLEQAGASFDIAINALAAITAKVSPFVFEARGLEAFSTSSGTEVPSAVSIIASLLREHARSVLAGAAPATLPTPTAPFAPTIAPKPATRSLFTLRAVSWTNGDGALRVAPKFSDAELPLDAADRAIAANVAVEMDSPLRNSSTRGQWPGRPDPANCFNLDATTEVDAGSPSQFQLVNRGPAYRLKIAGAAS